MGTIPGWLLRQAGQDVVIEPYAGSGGAGKAYGPPVTVRALVERKRRRVRATTGEQVVSETTLRLRLNIVDCPPGSKATLQDGTVSEVIVSGTHDGGTLPVPSHMEVMLT